MEPRVPETSSPNNPGPSTLPSVSVRPPQQRLHPVARPTEHWNLSVCPTTGGSYEFKVSPEETVDNFKRTVGRTLKLSKERINLLFKERLLKTGTLREYGVGPDSRLTLLPNVESGLLSQKTDHSVSQALENLSDHQVNEFLTGKSPLTLAMRLGDHMMFVQLQLSTSSSNSKRPHGSRGTAAAGTSSRHVVTSPGGRSVLTTPHARPDVTSQGTRTPLQPTPIYPHRHPGHLGHPIPHPHGVRTQFPMSFTPTSPTTSNGPFSRVFPSTSSGSTSLGRTSSSDSGAKGSANGVNKTQAPQFVSDTLAEASRNLSQKLKELSATPPTSSPVATAPPAPAPQHQARPAPSSSAGTPTTSPPASPSALVSGRRNSSGAIIESMHHHGQGVYSGTFSGTLNPNLQERDGRPKRSINTIVHILNDLLGASPQYRAQAARKPEVMHAHTRTHHVRVHRPVSPPHKINKTIGERIRLSQENRATRGKMEHIRQMLEERRHRRRVRREARSAATPYRIFHNTTHEEQASSSLASEQQPMDTLPPEGASYSEYPQETAVA